MDIYLHGFKKALVDSEILIRKYELEKCLIVSKAFCDLLDSDSDIEEYKNFVLSDDECQRQIVENATAKYGARTIYAALLQLSGNEYAARLHLAAHRFIAEKASQRLNASLGL